MTNTKSIPLSTAIDEYADYARLEVRQSPLSVKHRVVKLHHFAKFMEREFRLSDPTVTEVTVPHVRAFIKYLVDERNVCPQTVRGYLESLRAVYAYCQESEYVDDSPPHRIRMPKRNPPARELVSVEEILRMFDACDLLRPERRAKMASAILAVYVYGGLRTMEVLSLNVSDVSFDGKDCFIQIRHGKGDKLRVVPMHREAIPYVQEWLGARGQSLRHSGLWVTDARRPLGQKGLANLFSEIKWLARVNRPGLKPHSLRHNFATRKLRDGVSIYSIQKLLGHSNIETTVKYLHADMQHLTDVAQKGGLRANDGDRYVGFSP